MPPTDRTNPPRERRGPQKSCVRWHAMDADRRFSFSPKASAWLFLGTAAHLLLLTSSVAGQETNLPQGGGLKTYSSECSVGFEFDGTSDWDRPMDEDEIVFLASAWAHYHNLHAKDEADGSIKLLDCVFFDDGPAVVETQRRRLGRRTLRSDNLYRCSNCDDPGLVEEGLGRDLRARSANDDGTRESVVAASPSSGGRRSPPRLLRGIEAAADGESWGRRELSSSEFFNDFCRALKYFSESSIFSGIISCSAKCGVLAETTVDEWVTEHYTLDVVPQAAPPPPLELASEPMLSSHGGDVGTATVPPATTVSPVELPLETRDLRCDKREGKQCGVCEGKCKKHSECAGDLMCSDRKKYEAIPGCTGIGEKDKDYCYKAFDKHDKYACRSSPLNPEVGGPQEPPVDENYKERSDADKYYESFKVKNIEDCLKECMNWKECLGVSYSEYHKHRCELWHEKIGHVVLNDNFKCYKKTAPNFGGSGHSSHSRALESESEDEDLLVRSRDDDLYRPPTPIRALQDSSNATNSSVFVPPPPQPNITEGQAAHFHFKGVKDKACRFSSADVSLGGPLDPLTLTNPNVYYRTFPAFSLIECQENCINWHDCKGIEWDYSTESKCKLWTTSIGHMVDEPGVDCFVKSKTKLPAALRWGARFEDDDVSADAAVLSRWLKGDRWASLRSDCDVVADPIVEGQHVYHWGEYGGFLNYGEAYEQANNGGTAGEIITMYETSFVDAAG